MEPENGTFVTEDKRRASVIVVIVAFVTIPCQSMILVAAGSALAIRLVVAAMLRFAAAKAAKVKP